MTLLQRSLLRSSFLELLGFFEHPFGKFRCSGRLIRANKLKVPTAFLMGGFGRPFQTRMAWPAVPMSSKV